MGGPWGEGKYCLESRKLGSQDVLGSDLVLSIHGYMTMGRFYVSSVCLSILIHEREVILPTSQACSEGPVKAEW